MPDEATPAPEVTEETPAPEAATDTPEAEAPEQPEQQTQAEVDYEKRYGDLLPEYTRATQEAAQYREVFTLAQQGDKEAQEILRSYLAEQDTEDEDEYQDPDARLEQLEQKIAQQEESQQAAQAEQAFLVDVNDGIEKIEEREDRTLTDEETQFILAQAEHQARSGAQTLDIDGAFAPIETMSKTAVDRYLKSKKQAQSAPLGAAGDKKIDTSTPEGRKAAIAETFAAAQTDDS